MSFSLIVPVASDKYEYENKIPDVFLFDKEGIPFCIKSILGLELNKFDCIYFTILKSHDEKYCLKELLKLQFTRLGIVNANVIVLDNPTKSQSETIYETIQKAKITGSIYIKDADCSFTGEVLPHNGVAIYPLEKLSMVNPQHKSYVTVDEMYYITNIIEKKIISHYFNAGGYIFEDVNLYCKYFEKYRHNDGLCLSHIIYSMLLDRQIFRPILVDNYIDFENCGNEKN